LIKSVISTHSFFAIAEIMETIIPHFPQFLI